MFRCCSRKCWAFIVVVVSIAAYGLKWKIENAKSGKFGSTRAILKYEKHGKYGKSTAEDIVKDRSANFKDTVSIVTGVR